MKKHKKYIIGLIIICILHLIKNRIGVQTDEQYAMILGQKIANGSKLFKDCFEIHQTSGVFIAILLKIKYIFTNSNTYDLLYLKNVGLLIQCSISTFIYTKLLKNKYDIDKVTWVSLLFALVTPKISLMPDYALQQYWLLSIISIYLILYTNNKNINNKDIITIGILNSMLTIAYPPFGIISILLIIILKKDTIYYLPIYIGYILLYFCIFINKNIIYIKNIFGGSMHNLDIIDKLSVYFKKDIIQICWLLITSIFIIMAYIIKEKHKNNKTAKIIHRIILITLVIIQLFVVFVLKYCIAFNACYLIIIMISITSKQDDINIKSIYIILLASIIQLIVGNQFMFICIRYLFPILICCILIINDKIECRFLFIVSFACCLIQIALPSSSFYTFNNELKVIESGSLKGIYADKEIISKIEYIEYIDNLLKANKNKTILIMDSNLAMYNYTKFSMLCPDTINTPEYNKKFSIYYQNNKKPDIISYLNISGNVNVDGVFSIYLYENYDSYSTNNGVVFLLKEEENKYD